MHLTQGQSCISQRLSWLICRRSVTGFALPAKHNGLLVGLKNIKLPCKSTWTLGSVHGVHTRYFPKLWEVICRPNSQLAQAHTAQSFRSHERQGMHFLRLQGLYRLRSSPESCDAWLWMGGGPGAKWGPGGERFRSPSFLYGDLLHDHSSISHND